MAGKILVAEDDPEARELLLLLLGDADYCLLEAVDGVEALDLMRTELPDLLITDIVMPRMDGYELVRRMREDQTVAHTPVIFCSASYHERDVRAMASSLGVLETIAKPYDMSTVQALIAQVMSGSERPAAATAASDSNENIVAQHAHEMQDRLAAMVSFSRQLFSHTSAELIAESACRGAREILMAQCAQLTLRDADGTVSRCLEGGIPDRDLQRLLAATMFRDLLVAVEQGGTAIYPMVPPDPVAHTQSVAGEFLSMLGVPVASGSQVYGHLCLVNRIGLSAFTEEDASIARAIAAQVAVAHENSLRHYALKEQIGQRATAEAEVRRLNQDLEQRVVARTAELQIANRELEAFSYSVAHDLRAPLRLIDARAQMLLQALASLPNESAALLVEHVEDIRRGGARMNSLIDGLLALSRVSHIEMHKERVSLLQLVKEARERVEPQDDVHGQAPGHARRIEWRIAPLPQVRCDADLMRQVFVNLLDNAVKYSRSRSHAIIEIGISVENGEPCVFVRDNGVGFDTRYANKLFGVFQRLHHASEFEGTGIGLATVSRIIERHGGRIWAQASIGSGATFRFTLAGLSVPA